MSTSLRARRFANRPLEVTHPFIAFRLHQDWFALPLDAVQRVVSLATQAQDPSVSDPSQQDIRVTTVDPMEWAPIAIEQRIFRNLSGAVPTIFTEVSESQTSPAKAVCLILLKNSQGKTFGFSIDSQPQIHRIPESRMEPFLPSHPSYAHIRCVSTLLILTSEAQPLLLLDPSQLYAQESAVCSS